MDFGNPRAVERAAKISLTLTAINVIAKLVLGFMAHSVSVIAEGMHSSIDVLISFGVLKTVQIAHQPPDEDHPYGHGKAEVLLGAGQMILIIITAVLISIEATRRLVHPERPHVGVGAIAMLMSVVITFGLSRYLDKVGKANHSPALLGESMHIRGDLYSSGGILLGLGLVKLTDWPILDPLIALIMMLYIMYSAVKVLKDLIHPLMDGALPAEDRAKIQEVLDGHPAARGFHFVRTRQVGPLKNVDLHVLLDDHLTFVEAHDQAEEIEAELSEALGGALVQVHYEPYEAELRHQQQSHSDHQKA